jgi:hypothetical protein
MEIKWTDIDPSTGERCWVRAERFSREWRFTYRSRRRGIWAPGPPPTRAMWEHVLDALERRNRRREGVTEADLAQVKGFLGALTKPEPNGEE